MATTALATPGRGRNSASGAHVVGGSVHGECRARPVVARCDLADVRARVADYQPRWYEWSVVVTGWLRTLAPLPSASSDEIPHGELP